jgi:hypothetical protein
MIIYIGYIKESLPLIFCKSLSCLIPIPKTYFWNKDVGNDFVNKSEDYHKI